MWARSRVSDSHTCVNQVLMHKKGGYELAPATVCAYVPLCHLLVRCRLPAALPPAAVPPLRRRLQRARRRPLQHSRDCAPRKVDWQARPRPAVQGDGGQGGGGRLRAGGRRDGRPAGRMRQILVIGHNEGRHCTRLHEDAAYDAGLEIARSGSALLTGGLGGVMGAASRGARDGGGLVVGIIPQDAHQHANDACDIVIPTGMGLTRDFVNALSADGIVVIGGGAGTLSEMCAAYMHRRPMVAVRGTGGTADEYAGRYMDERRTVRVEAAGSPAEAVRMIVSLVDGGRAGAAGGGDAERAK